MYCQPNNTITVEYNGKVYSREGRKQRREEREEVKAAAVTLKVT